jgi:hypothetical protein
MLPFKRTEPEKICLVFERKRNPPEKSRNFIQTSTIRFSISKNPIVEVPKSHLRKRGTMSIYFFQKKDHG